MTNKKLSAKTMHFRLRWNILGDDEDEDEEETKYDFNFSHKYRRDRLEC